MSTRLDLVLQKYPEHEDGIRLLASRDPSGNLKYLDWGAKMLASEQALAPEVADILDLFQQFKGRWLGKQGKREQVNGDVYAYRPQDLAKLRSLLLKIKRATDRKRHKRELLYRIEGEVEADVIYDSAELVVRHIKNKQASVHYGLSTKWCIAMRREGYFEDYESHNAIFFFFERKAPVGDEFDKIALMVPRNGEEPVTGYTSIDRRVDIMTLAKVYGTRVFDIFREVYECSERYPGSAMLCVCRGSATQEQIESVFASIVKGSRYVDPYEMDLILEAICCNDAAPLALLKKIERQASALSLAAWKRSRRRGRRPGHDSELVRTIAAALVIHPSVPADVREKLVKELRRRHVNVDKIHRVVRDDRVGVSWSDPIRGYRYHHHVRRHSLTLSNLRSIAQRLDRRAIQIRKKIEKLEKKQKQKKRKG
jgi:hypothetical protein